MAPLAEAAIAEALKKCDRGEDPRVASVRRTDRGVSRGATTKSLSPGAAS